MESCDAVERELDKVTSKFGNVCQDSIDKLNDIIEKLKSVQKRWSKLPYVFSFFPKFMIVCQEDGKKILESNVFKWFN